MQFQDRDFLPVILGTDTIAYSVARAFHEAYQVKSLMVARAITGPARYSQLLEYWVEPELDHPDVFSRTMDEVYEKYKDSGKALVLVGCMDHYVRLIVAAREELADRFILPYTDQETLDKLALKEPFYALCDQYGLDYAPTFVHKPDTGYDYELNIDFPVVLKPSDTVSYQAHQFEDFHKIFFLNDRETLDETLKKIYAAGYEGSMIIQNEIPGEDANIYDLHCYMGSDGKLKMMNMGNVVLEQHAPTTVGNNAATIVEPHLAFMKKVQALLEGIGWQGLCDGDIKYDARDGRFKMLEINIRQGQSNYRVTGGGDNIARLLVEDFVYHRELPGPKFCEEPFFWHVVPLDVVYTYVKDKERVAQIKSLVAAGKVCHSLDYPEDGGFLRKLYLKYRDMRMRQSFKRYMGSD